MAERHFTDVEIERQLAGDLRRPFETEATADDKARLAELEHEHAAFLASVDVDAEVRRIQQRVERAQSTASAGGERKSWLRWLVPMGAFAAAAAAIVIYIATKKPAHTDDPDILYKGDGVSLVIYVKAGDSSQRLQSGDTIASGAKIRFEIQGVKQGYVAVVGVDGTGTASVYYPSNSPQAAQLGDDHLLHVAIQLDATPGDEQFYAVYATAPFMLDAVLPSIRGQGTLPAGVTTSHVVLHKLVNK
jgi:hypothetical protein